MPDGSQNRITTHYESWDAAISYMHTGCWPLKIWSFPAAWFELCSQTLKVVSTSDGQLMAQLKVLKVSSIMWYHSKAYIMVSNSLVLESRKVRRLRVELVSNKLWVILHFLRPKTAIISKNFTSFPVKIVEIIAIFVVKFAHDTSEILFNRAEFLSFWKSYRVGWELYNY